MKNSFLLAFLIFVAASSMAQINLKKLKEKVAGAASGGLSTEEVAQGLKEALTNGVSKGSDLVSQVDGYLKNQEIKIPFPPEVQQVETKLRQIGLGSEVDKLDRKSVV